MLEGGIQHGEAQTSPLQRGQSMGRYLILERIGEGGMALVLTAYDPQLDRRVAIKLLREASAESGHARLRLLREAQAMARLSHPNVVAVHDAGIHDGQVFLTMDLWDGGTLAAWLENGDRSWREILAAFVSAGKGLAAAHRAGLVHRDFKPDNVLFDSQGRVGVTDFGLARLSGELDPPGASEGDSQSPGLDASITHTGSIMGTRGYIPPERFFGAPADARGDQFGFCVSLYQALYRRPPYRASTEEILAGEPMPLPDPPWEGGVPRKVRRALLRGLSPSPEARYPSMEALLADLERAVDPRRARLSFALAATALGAVAWALAQAGQPGVALCEPRGNPLAGAWDGARKAAVEGAFAGSGRAMASDAWVRVRGGLDRFAAEWLALRTETCSHAGTAPSETWVLQAVCLQRRRSDLAKLTDNLSRADGLTVDRAAASVQRLGDPRDCADPQRPRGEEDRAVELAAVRSQLDLIASLREEGKAEEGLKLARDTEAAVRSLADDAMEALYRRRLALLQADMGQLSEAESSLVESWRLAYSAGADEMTAQALISLVWVVGELQRRHDDGLRWGRLAEAAVNRLGPNDELESRLLHNLGSLYLDTNDFPRAEVQFRRSLVLRERLFGEHHLLSGRSRASLGFALMGQGRLGEAEALLSEASAILDRAVGRDDHRAQQANEWLLATRARLGAAAR
jgi:hypothetical protein